MAGRPTLREFIRGISVWGPITIAAVLTPTLDQLLSFVLVSNYWQPNLDRSAGVIAGLVCIATYGCCLRMRMIKRRKLLMYGLMFFALSLVGCAFIQITDVPNYVDGRFYKDSVVAINVGLYVLVHVAFSVILMQSYLIIFRKSDF